MTDQRTDPADDARPCPLCGSPPTRVYVYTYPTRRVRMAYCAPCQRTFSPGPDPARRPRPARYRRPRLKLTDIHDPILTYANVHQRLRLWRGRPRDLVCVDCGAPAQDWSYNLTGIHERTEQRTMMGRSFTVTYSTDLRDYDPRCRSCHHRLDAVVQGVSFWID